MKYSSIAFLLLFVCCQKKYETTAIALEESNPENQVEQLIAKVNGANTQNRKQVLSDFLNYSANVDGAAAEAYSNFAFEYANENSKQFFAALNARDTVMLQKWAAISAGEVMILGDTTKGIDSVLTTIQIAHRKNKMGLSPTEFDLEEMYLKMLALAARK